MSALSHDPQASLSPTPPSRLTSVISRAERILKLGADNLDCLEEIHILCRESENQLNEWMKLAPAPPLSEIVAASKLIARIVCIRKTVAAVLLSEAKKIFHPDPTRPSPPAFLAPSPTRAASPSPSTPRNSPSVLSVNTSVSSVSKNSPSPDQASSSSPQPQSQSQPQPAHSRILPSTLKLPPAPREKAPTTQNESQNCPGSIASLQTDPNTARVRPGHFAREIPLVHPSRLPAAAVTVALQVEGFTRLAEITPRPTNPALPDPSPPTQAVEPPGENPTPHKTPQAPQVPSPSPPNSQPPPPKTHSPPDPAWKYPPPKKTRI